jgi:hypothetical protein
MTSLQQHPRAGFAFLRAGDFPKLTGMIVCSGRSASELNSDPIDDGGKRWLELLPVSTQLESWRLGITVGAASGLRLEHGVVGGASLLGLLVGCWAGIDGD